MVEVVEVVEVEEILWIECWKESSIPIRGLAPSTHNCVLKKKESRFDMEGRREIRSKSKSKSKSTMNWITLSKPQTLYSPAPSTPNCVLKKEKTGFDMEERRDIEGEGVRVRVRVKKNT